MTSASAILTGDRRKSGNEKEYTQHQSLAFEDQNNTTVRPVQLGSMVVEPRDVTRWERYVWWLRNGGHVFKLNEIYGNFMI